MLTQTFEATLSDDNKKYTDKVNALLSAWEYVANAIIRSKHHNQNQQHHQQQQQQQKHHQSPDALVEWANEHTLKLVLRGEWPRLGKATKTHLDAQLNRCAKELTEQKLESAAKRCQALIDLVQNPWGKPALDKIVHGQLNTDHEEEEFCCQEKGELLKMRLRILCEERCHDIAMNLAAACVRSLRRNDRLRELSDPSHVQFMIDLYIVLLQKERRINDIVEQLKHMELKDSLEMMQRLSGERPTKYGTARVWRNSGKAATIVANYLITAGMVRPLAEVGSDVLERILNSWAMMHKKTKDPVASMPAIVRKFIENAESAQHIFIFCQVLVRHFGVAPKPLVIELYIRALTTDLNELETQKLKSDKAKVQETAQRLSNEILHLADYVSDFENTARECVLTAFSLHPTRACYDRIRQMAIACGKFDPKPDTGDDSLKVEIVDKTEVEEDEPKNEKPARSLNELEIESIERIVGAPVNPLNKQPSTSSCQTDTTTQEPRLGDEPATTVSIKREESSAEDVSVDKKPSEAELEIQPKTDSETPKAPSNVEADSKVEAPLPAAEANAPTGSQNENEKAALSMDGEKLGSWQLSDDLSVLLSSQRFHLIDWQLEWKDLSELCERYLENAEEMRNSNKKLKYLHIDYSQFKDKPYDEDSLNDRYGGIEKGYEQWEDSDYSESGEHYQTGNNAAGAPALPSPDDSSTDNSENIPRRHAAKGRPRKVSRLDSSESEIERKNRKPRQRFRKVLVSSSESDNTQDSQTSSLGSDGCKKNQSKKIGKKSSCNGVNNKVIKRRSKKTKAIIDPFHIFVNENLLPSGVMEDPGSNMMTLFSADENRRETIQGSAAFNAVQINIKKQSNPEVIKSLRMFRPTNKKQPQVNGIKRKENNNVDENSANSNNAMPKFAPPLSSLNLSPKIALRRVDEVDKHLLSTKKVSAQDLSDELRHIKKSMPFPPAKNSLSGYQKQKSRSRQKATKSDIKELLTVPGMHSMEFSVVPRVQPTVHVVQLTRNIPQSPNSTASGNTPPRSRSNIQLPGTPSSGGHDSGVGMSPAGQTPPPPTRSSSLQDVGEEANQPPDNSPGLDSTNTSTMDSTDSSSTRTVALTVLANPRLASNQSPKKSPSPLTNNAQEQHVVVRKADGTYHLVSPSVVAGQRSILQNFEDANISFARQVTSVAGADTKTTQAQASRNAALPKFQQAFGKTICTLSTESTTVPSTSAADTRESPAAPAGAATNVQRANAKATGAVNAAKTSVQNASIVSIPNLQQAGARQILNIVQNANSNATTAGGGPTLQLVQNSTQGNPVIYSIPSTQKIAGQNATQLISIPAAAIANSGGNRAPVQVKLNIIRTPYRPGQQIHTVVHTHTPRVQTPAAQQSQAQQQQAARPGDPMINSSMEMAGNQVSSSTLEQLREFDSVLEQVKQRSTGQSSSADTTTVQTQTQTVPSATAVKQQTQQQQVTVGALTQQLLMSSQSPSSAVEYPSNGSAGTLTFQQQEGGGYPQKVALMYTNKSSGSSTPNSTPVVVVTSYCQPAASPALSVTSQSSSSPCVTPAPTPVSSTGKTPPQSSKNSKKATTPKSVKVSAQTAAKQAPIPKPQQKPQEDPETTQRIYAILGQYAEQLRNSPDLNNKPAPRRRSNPPTNPNQSSKRKKSGSGKSKASGQQTSEPSPSADDLNRTMGSSEDSSGGGGGAGSISGNGNSLMHIQDSPAGYSASEETMASSNNNSQGGNNDNATLGNIMDIKPTIVTSDSNDSLEGSVKRRNLIFTEPNTARAVIVQEAPNVGDSIASSLTGGKVTTGTAVLVSGTNFMLPMNFVKSGQQITVVSGGSKLLAAVPAVRTTGNASGVPNAFVLQSLLSQANKAMQQQHNQPKLKLAHQSQIVIPQTGGVVRFANDDSSSSSCDNKSEVKAETSKQQPAPSATIGLFQHSGVITSNPTIGSRILNSSTVKLPPAAAVKSENGAQKVVCLTTPTKKEPVDAQNTTTTIALAFTPSADGAGAASIAQTIKEIKDEPKTETLVATTPNKGIKRKEEQMSETTFQCNAATESPQPSNKKIKQQSPQAPAMTPTTITSSMDSSSQFLVSGGPTSSDSQESASSAIPNSAIESSSMDGTKVENGVLCGNARLQEAWEPERKGSPDTPWRFTPTTNALVMEPLKVYSRDGESSETVTVHNSVLQTISKGQGIELSSGGIFQTKKFFPSMNNAKSSLAKTGQTSNARTTAEQENQQRALEHQLRLQKSLSEECEDLGVGEPSTSDLFPEAELLFDTNHSPAFDHSSQEASCSQTPSGSLSLTNSKSYAAASGTSFFKSIDSASSGSRDASPVVAPKNAAPAAKKKAPVQRRATKPKESPAKKNKRSSDGLQHADAAASGAPQAKHIRLSLVENLTSQDEASNSNSDVSRLSPVVGNGSSKETDKAKVVNKNKAKPHDGASHELADTAARLNVVVNNASSCTSSEEDESLTLLENNASNVTIASPVASVGGHPHTNNRYTYANNKKRPAANATAVAAAAVKNQRPNEFFSTESPASEITRSSTDNDEDEEDEVDPGDDESSSVSETFGPTEISSIGNGLQDIIRNVPTVKVTPVDHLTYAAKRKAPTVVRKATVNHKDSTSGPTTTVNKSADAKAATTVTNPSGASKKARIAVATPTLSENEASSPAPSGDKVYEISPSDDEASSTTVLSNSTLEAGMEHCTTAAGRRSSLRGHVKKGNCGCCNGSPERPKVKKIGPSKAQSTDPLSAKLKKPKQQPQQQQQHQQQQQQPAKQLAKKR